MDLCDAVSPEGWRCDKAKGHEKNPAHRIHRSLLSGFFAKAERREPHPPPPPPPEA